MISVCPGGVNPAATACGHPWLVVAVPKWTACRCSPSSQNWRAQRPGDSHAGGWITRTRRAVPSGLGVGVGVDEVLEPGGAGGLEAVVDLADRREQQRGGGRP